MDNPQPFFPARLLNFLWKLRAVPQLEPAALMEEADRKTGFSDWGEGDFRSGLTVFCRSVNQDSGLHPYGRSIVRRLTTDRLVDRLRIQNALREQPEILERPVWKPILITGQPRTGSTMLHRLLALDPQFRVPRFWEIYHPLPPPDPAEYETDRRIRKMAREVKRIHWIAPSFRTAHPVDAAAPEECYPLLERALNKPVSCIWLDIPEYQEWLLSRSVAEVAADYRYYRKQLQILQWRFARLRWVLKAPIHAFYLPSILSVLPDVVFIQTHRRPTETVPSLCSLASSLRTALYRSENNRRLGQRLLELGGIQADRFLDARRDAAPEKFIDVYYDDLVADPVSMVTDLYRRLHLSLSPSARTQMKEFLSEQRRGPHTRHRYSLEQFGLNRARVVARFERYLDRFPRLAGGAS
jgi:hypothetical protein